MTLEVAADIMERTGIQPRDQTTRQHSAVHDCNGDPYSVWFLGLIRMEMLSRCLEVWTRHQLSIDVDSLFTTLNISMSALPHPALCTAMAPPRVQCHCTVHNCNGAEMTYNERREHLRDQQRADSREAKRREREAQEVRVYQQIQSIYSLGFLRKQRPIWTPSCTR